jgi:hypothetical protein
LTERRHQVLLLLSFWKTTDKLLNDIFDI